MNANDQRLQASNFDIGPCKYPLEKALQRLRQICLAS